MGRKHIVLIVNPSSALGGGSTISYDIATNLDQEEFDVFMFFPQRGPVSQILNRHPHIKVLISPGQRFGSIILFLYRFLRDHHIDIIHAHGTRSAFWIKIIFPLLLLKRPKFIYTLHGLHIVRRSFLFRYFLLYIERISNILVDTIVCPSVSVQKLVRDYKLINPTKSILIPNGVRIVNSSVTRPSDIPFSSVSFDTVITAVQRLEFPKDVSTILKSFKIVQKKIHNIIFLVVGDGSLKEDLLAESEKLYISDRVFFLGDRSDVPSILSISDIVILSSKFEALGLSLLEAMSFKKAVIGSDVDGIREIVRDGENGFLFSFGNADDLASKIEHLALDQVLREEMGLCGYNLVKELFSLPKMISLYRELFIKMLYENPSNK